MQLPWNTTPETDLLDQAIERLYTLMAEEEPDTEKYSVIVDQLAKLHKLKEDEKSTKTRVSPDTLAMILGNLAGIGFIIWHEKAGIITSKALGFVIKSIR